MTLKKKNFSEDEVALFDNAVIYKRGDFWHFRMWLVNERKYARFSLKTRNKQTAIDKAEERYYELKVLEKQKKPYFSITAKDGVAKYLAVKQKDVEDRNIVKGRLSTIKTHLEHWLDFIKRDKKLKDLERMDCYEYSSTRLKGKKGIAVSQTTIKNEQSTINAMISWLYKNKLIDFDGFEFKKMKAVDKGNEDLRRSIFTHAEMANFWTELNKYLDEALVVYKKDDSRENYVKVVTSFYIVFMVLTGMRRGELLQLRWQDVKQETHKYKGNKHELLQITVRWETSKVGRTRRFMIEDLDYYDRLLKLAFPKFTKQEVAKEKPKKFADSLIFSTDGHAPITVRAIDYHYKTLLKKAEIEDLEKRNIVPYSCRHYFITEKLNSNLTIQAVADMCGTSPKQIQDTYYHITKERMITNALAKYVVKDGIIFPVK
jgi:integrase